MPPLAHTVLFGTIFDAPLYIIDFCWITIHDNPFLDKNEKNYCKASYSSYISRHTMPPSLNHTPVPFDDTYVLYNPEDPLSLVSVFFTLLPIGILIFYLSWFIITREIEPVIMAGGQVVNDVLNNIVKNIVKQERPVKIEGFQEKGLRSGYGMPSAHSQFMGYVSVYLILRIWLQWRGLSKGTKLGSSFLLIATAWAVMASRVYLSYHDIAQVSVGYCIGATLGAVYFLVISIARSIGIVDWVLTWRIVSSLWVKDSVYFEPLSLKDEYEAWIKRRDCNLKKD